MASTSKTRFLNIDVLATEAVVSLDEVREDGFHFSWNLQEMDGPAITEIKLRATPVKTVPGVNPVEQKLATTAKNGILSNLTPFTEYDTFVDVTRTGVPMKTHQTGPATSYPKGK